MISVEVQEDEKMSSALKDGVVGVGRKLLMATFVVSSAPLVVPPLAVISAMGALLSVPCGVFLASYVCTHKLMSKLLPDATPPLLSSFLLPYEVEDEDGNLGLVKENDEEDEVGVEIEYPSEKQPEDGVKVDGIEEKQVEEQDETETGEAIHVQLVTTTIQYQEKAEDTSAPSDTQQISEREELEFNVTPVSLTCIEVPIQTDGAEQKVQDQNRRDDNQIEPSSTEFVPQSKPGEAKDATNVQLILVDTTVYQEKPEDTSAPLNINKQISEQEEYENNHARVSSASNEQTGGQPISIQPGSKGERKKNKDKRKRKTGDSGSAR
ncbi:uncharacterized protein LOC110809398 isoform X2 [Carica papaya]|uniref:uncharacterized protein LOC110809398 isoform X2 n=1 Tax=Carica papaya TaxID=3649 RepID=UPI000B8C8512|nr:uncharacterized protein LOC110809398 isoform X2 [Carica papaya]